MVASLTLILICIYKYSDIIGACKTVTRSHNFILYTKSFDFNLCHEQDDITEGLQSSDTDETS